MGVLYAFFGAGFFALGSVLARRGQQEYRADDGAPITGAINFVILGAIAAVLLIRSPVVWDWRGIVAFVVAGILTTGLGRLSSMASVRALGPSRATLYKVSAPLFTVVGAYIILGERLQALEAVGGVLVLGGLWLLATESRTPRAAAAGQGEVAAAAEQGAGGASTTRGILYGLGAALFFGLGFVVRKLGLAYIPAVFLGSAIGAAAGLCTTFSLAWMKRGLVMAIRTAFLNVPVWFVFSGLSSAVAVLGQFVALTFLSASSVSVLLATEPLWTILIGRFLFPGQETVTARVVVCACLVFCGVMLMVLV